MQNIRKDTTSDYLRGHYADTYLKELYNACILKDKDRLLTEREIIHKSYFRYICNRKLRLIILSGSYNITGLKSYLDYAINALIEIISGISNTRDKSDKAPEVTLNLVNEYINTDKSKGFAVGSEKYAKLGETTALGSSTACSVSILKILITLDTQAFQMMIESPWAIFAFLEGCELGIPLNLDYDINIRIASPKALFELHNRKLNAEAYLGYSTPILGYSTILRDNPVI